MFNVYVLDFKMKKMLYLISVKKTNLDISKCLIYEAVMKYFFAKISSNYEVICEFFQEIRSD